MSNHEVGEPYPHELWTTNVPAALVSPLFHTLATLFLGVCSLKKVENQI